MSSLSEIYIKKETLKTMLDVLEKKQDKGISLTVSTGDRLNDYGQNLLCYVSQTKEQREAKKKKFYVGNGKCFWTDGVISDYKTLEKKMQQQRELEESEEVDNDNSDLGEYFSKEPDFPF